MSEFRVRSSESEAVLRFAGIRGDYFTVALTSGPVYARRDVWTYTDAHGLADFLNGWHRKGSHGAEPRVGSLSKVNSKSTQAVAF